MIRAIIWMGYFWIYLVFTFVDMIKVKWLERQNKIAERDAFIHKRAMEWAKKMVAFTGSKITVTGEENIPKEGGVLFVGNHQSNFDIPILIGYINKPKAFITKSELSRVPIFSTWMKAIGCIFINRKNARQSLIAINQGAERLKQGYSIVIFPEGTRSQDGSVGEFKAGSLKLATKSKVPIIPVTIKGSMNIMPKKGFVIRPAAVEVIISPPVMIDPAIKNDSNQISEIVRNIIISQL
ncbi:MAG TPA: lysophospholipid acyltransferase family protein [Ruminiclostridium sp.]